ncbi:MAG: hypothetical protein HRU20_01095 [Pseudomonadales bacterium]|nr:hypothetical protein [Pseudomonadales bacterium]
MNNMDLTRGFLARLLSLYPQQARWPQENAEDFEALVVNYAPMVEEMGQQELFKRLDFISELKRSLASEVQFYSQALDVCFAYRGALVNLKNKYGLHHGKSSDTTIQHLLEAERKASCTTEEALQARAQLNEMLSGFNTKAREITTVTKADKNRGSDALTAGEKAEFERLMGK